MNEITPKALLPAPRSDFIGFPDSVVHLASGGEPPLLKSHREAFERFAADKANGFNGYHSHWRLVDTVRGQLAVLLSLQADEIGLLGNTSEAIVRVLSSIEWRPGDNVVVAELDYASGRWALSDLSRRGVEVRWVSADGWDISAECLLAACDDRTRAMYVSQVNATTGQHLDIDIISAGLAPTATMLIVDASHALGVVPVDGRRADFTVSCCYKFLMGVHDGVLAWNRRRQPDFRPAGVGWWSADSGDGPGGFDLKDDARRAEFGNVDHLGAYLLNESLSYLEQFGIDAIAAHVRELSGRLVDGMRALDLDVMTPTDPLRRAASASFACSDPGAVVQRAVADKVLVWGDGGRVRASTHLFTTPDDITACLDRLPAWLEG